MAAELMAPKWFDKNPALSNEDNFEQLRNALRIARGLYTDGGVDSAFGHFARHYQAQIGRGAQQGLNSLVANYGPALIDRAVLDALCRALRLPFHEVIRAQPGRHPGHAADARPGGLRPRRLPGRAAAGGTHRRSPHRGPGRPDHRRRPERTRGRRPARDAGRGGVHLRPPLVQAQGGRQRRRRRGAAAAHRLGARPHRWRLPQHAGRQRAVRQHRRRAAAVAAHARRSRACSACATA